MAQSKNFFVQRTKRKEQLMLFVTDEFKKRHWIVLSSIQNYLENLGVSNPDSRYIENLLSKLAEDKYIKLYGCMRCDKSEGINCSDCPYELYKKEMEKEEIEDGIVNDHRSLAKFVVIPTALGIGYADVIGREIEGCNRFVHNKFGN